MSALQSFNKAHTFTQHLVSLPVSALPRPRICLVSGQLVGCSIRAPHYVSAAAALEHACTLAHETGMLVSLSAIGPLLALPDLAAAAIARADVTPEHLELTVTGHALHHAGIEALLALSALRDQGISVALRGFGRGPIAIVPRLPLTRVILSATTIQDIPGNPAATMLLHTLLGLARSQDLRVVATGIDTETQRAILAGIGCDTGEGSLFGATKAAPLHP